MKFGNCFLRSVKNIEIGDIIVESNFKNKVIDCDDVIVSNAL